MPPRRGFLLRGLPNCPPPGISPEDEQGCVDYALHFVRLWLRYSRSGASWQPGGRPPEQDDLESAALFGVAKAIRAWAPGKGRFSTYLSRAVSWSVQNALEDGRRARYASYRDFRARCVSLEDLRAREEAGEGGEVDPASAEAGSEVRADAERLLEALPERERVLVRRHYLEGDPLNRVAAEIGIPYRTAKSLLAHARDLLREMDWE